MPVTEIVTEFTFTCDDCPESHDYHIFDWDGDFETLEEHVLNSGDWWTTPDGKILCEDCYEAGKCEVCEKYVGRDNLLDTEEYGYICANCEDDIRNPLMEDRDDVDAHYEEGGDAD
jgi:hypothetical protein